MESWGGNTLIIEESFVGIFQCYKCYTVTPGCFFRKRSIIYINYLLLIYILFTYVQKYTPV